MHTLAVLRGVHPVPGQDMPLLRPQNHQDRAHLRPESAHQEYQVVVREGKLY